MHPAFLTIVLFSVIQGDNISNESSIPVFSLSSRNPQKSLIDLMISLAIPMFKKPSFEQEILSVLYTPDIQGRLQIIVKVAEKNVTLGGLGGPYCSFVLQRVFAVLQHPILVQAGHYRNSAISSICRGEVWYDSKSKPELMSACQTHIQMPFA